MKHLLPIAPRKSRAIVAAVALMLLVLGALPAEAGTPKGTRVITANSGWPSGTYSLSDWTSYYLTPQYFHLRVFAQANVLAHGKCFDTWYDWSRPGHYDARLARTCSSQFYSDSGTQSESTSVQLAGMNKQGACYGSSGATTTPITNCVQAFDETSSLSTVVPAIPNYSTRDWYVSATGAVRYDTGGIQTEPHI